jgi:hypothetical protein
MAALPNLPISDWLQQGRSGIKFDPTQERDGRGKKYFLPLVAFYQNKFGRSVSYPSADGSVDYFFRRATVEVLYISEDLCEGLAFARLILAVDLSPSSLN